MKQEARGRVLMKKTRGKISRVSVPLKVACNRTIEYVLGVGRRGFAENCGQRPNISSWTGLRFLAGPGDSDSRLEPAYVVLSLTSRSIL